MTIAINILLSLVAFVLLTGVIGEKDKDKQKNVTLAFAAVLAVIVAVNTIM